jgi:hypothetical protein
MSASGQKRLSADAAAQVSYGPIGDMDHIDNMKEAAN